MYAYTNVGGRYMCMLSNTYVNIYEVSMGGYCILVYDIK